MVGRQLLSLALVVPKYPMNASKNIQYKKQINRWKIQNQKYEWQPIQFQLQSQPQDLESWKISFNLPVSQNVLPAVGMKV